MFCVLFFSFRSVGVLALRRRAGESVVSVLERAGGAVTTVEKASIDEVYVDVTQAAQALLSSLSTATGGSSDKREQQQQQQQQQSEQQQQLKMQRESNPGELEQQGGLDGEKVRERALELEDESS